jgi:hypothetical protein
MYEGCDEAGGRNCATAQRAGRPVAAIKKRRAREGSSAQVLLFSSWCLRSVRAGLRGLLGTEAVKLPEPRAAEERLPLVRREAQYRARGSLLSRRPMVRPGRSATSTQLPLEKLSELLTQLGPESGVSGELPNIGLPTITSRLFFLSPDTHNVC